jgi:hypothetical protein
MRFPDDFRRWRKKSSEYETDQDLSFSDELDRLRLSTSGVAFIYASMSAFVSRFEMRDVVVVLDDGNGGTQLFRYGGKAIARHQRSLIDASPGAYSDPSSASQIDLDLLFERCRDEFEGLRIQGDTADSTLSGRRFRINKEKNFRHGFDEPVEETTPDIYEIEQRREPKPGDEAARVRVSRLFVYVTVLNAFWVLIGVTGPPRYLCGLVLGVAIPGWAIVGRLKLHYAALEIGLSIATSLAILIVSAQVLITIHFWHLTIFDLVLSVAVLPSLLYQSGWPLSYRWWRR